MEVFKIDGSRMDNREDRRITEKDLRTEFAFLVSSRLAGVLLESGVITSEQHDVLMEKNARSFPCSLASLSHLTTCYKRN